MITVLDSIRQQYLPAARAGVNTDFAASYELRIGEAAPTFIHVNHGQVAVDTHPHATHPRVILEFRDEQTFFDLLNGRRHPMLAFLHGDLRSHGHLVLSMRFFGVFDPARLPQDTR